MCSFLLFAEDFCGLSVKFAIAIYPRKNPLRRYAPALPKGELLQLPLPGDKLPLRGKTSSAPGEDVAQRQKGESGTA